MSHQLPSKISQLGWTCSPQKKGKPAMSLTQHLADFYEVMVLMCCFGLHRTTQKHHKPLKYYKTHISCEKFYLLEIHIYIYRYIHYLCSNPKKKSSSRRDNSAANLLMQRKGPWIGWVKDDVPAGLKHCPGEKKNTPTPFSRYPTGNFLRPGNDQGEFWPVNNQGGHLKGVGEVWNSSVSQKNRWSTKVMQGCLQKKMKK